MPSRMNYERASRRAREARLRAEEKEARERDKRLGITRTTAEDSIEFLRQKKRGKGKQ